MKILFVHDTKFKEDREGELYTGGSFDKEVWNRYLEISNKLSVIARRDPTIYQTNTAQKDFNFFDKEKIKFVKISSLKSSIKSYFNLKTRKKNNKIIKNEIINNDFIIVRIPSESGNTAIKYARKLKKPYLVEVVGCSWDALWNYNLKGKILAPFSFLTLRKLVKKAPYALYVTNSFLQKRYPTKGASVNCSNVSLEYFNSDVLKKRLEKINDLSEEDKVIIGTTAAIDVRYKGQQYVIKALGKLKKQGLTNIEYHLVGSGDQSFLKSIAQDYDVSGQVKFLGTIPHKEVFKWLDSIDIYIQPSRQEGLPRALIESMSRGLPALGANTAGIPELLETKFIFSNTSKNIDEICEIIQSLNKTLMLEQAKRNYMESKKYDKRIIDKRRNEFFIKFINNQ